MSDKTADNDRNRKARLGAALRENLKRRKLQAKAQNKDRAGKPIVTPDDDAGIAPEAATEQLD